MDFWFLADKPAVKGGAAHGKRDANLAPLRLNLQADAPDVLLSQHRPDACRHEHCTVLQPLALARDRREDRREDRPDAEVARLFACTRYINLDRRTDRRKHIEDQLRSLELSGCMIQPARFSAVKHSSKKGNVGCALSHLEVLNEALAQSPIPEHLCVFEDDAVFHDADRTIRALQRVHRNHPDWDVILLGGNNAEPFEHVDRDCVQVKNCCCAHAYIVKRSFLPVLRANFAQACDKLVQAATNNYPRGHPHFHEFAIDMYWRKLQKQHKFLLLQPMLVSQLPSYSDIGNEFKDYDSLRKDVGKDSKVFQA